MSETVQGLDPVILEGKRVRMEPLSIGMHWEGLLAIGTDPDLWKWTLNVCETPEALRAYLDTALREQSEGRSLPFVTRDLVTGQVAGCTRFGNIDLHNRRVEIGWTWVGRPFQRSHVNTEAKYLMMTHAFESVGCVRVELKTNALNSRSRNAMLRIGCKEEGTLRKHGLTERGVWRDTVFFSVLDTEWPGVKAGLEEMMKR
ncbi:MAG: GNAT family protein [Candidatus Eisenbacteria bacterium]